MFARDQDFECDTSAGIVLCVGLKPEVTSTFKVLQLQLSRLLPQLPNPPKVAVIVDGVIGPSVALSLQMVIARIARGYPGVLHDLRVLVYAPAEQMILEIARHADLLTSYINQILTHDPNAVRSPPPLAEPKPEDPVAFAKRIFTTKRLIASGVALAGLAGLTAVASASDSRALGRIDRSSFLPESDGTDEDDDADEDDEPDVIDAPVNAPILALPSPAA